jgi:hypothetical protein
MTVLPVVKNLAASQSWYHTQNAMKHLSVTCVVRSVSLKGI